MTTPLRTISFGEASNRTLSFVTNDNAFTPTIKAIVSRTLPDGRQITQSELSPNRIKIFLGLGKRDLPLSSLSVREQMTFLVTPGTIEPIEVCNDWLGKVEQITLKPSFAHNLQPPMQTFTVLEVITESQTFFVFADNRGLPFLSAWGSTDSLAVNRMIVNHSSVELTKAIIDKLKGKWVKIEDMPGIFVLSFSYDAKDPWLTKSKFPMGIEQIILTTALESSHPKVQFVKSSWVTDPQHSKWHGLSFQDNASENKLCLWFHEPNPKASQTAKKETDKTERKAQEKLEELRRETSILIILIQVEKRIRAMPKKPFDQIVHEAKCCKGRNLLGKFLRDLDEKENPELFDLSGQLQEIIDSKGDLSGISIDDLITKVQFLKGKIHPHYDEYYENRKSYQLSLSSWVFEASQDHPHPTSSKQTTLQLQLVKPHLTKMDIQIIALKRLREKLELLQSYFPNILRSCDRDERIGLCQKSKTLLLAKFQWGYSNRSALPICLEQQTLRRITENLEFLLSQGTSDEKALTSLEKELNEKHGWIDNAFNILKHYDFIDGDMLRLSGLITLIENHITSVGKGNYYYEQNLAPIERDLKLASDEDANNLKLYKRMDNRGFCLFALALKPATDPSSTLDEVHIPTSEFLQ